MLLNTLSITKENNMDFKGFLAKKINEHGLSLRQLELETGINRGNFSAYMSGTRTPNVQTIYKLAIYFAAAEADKQSLDESSQQLLKSAYIVGMVRMLGEQNVD